MGIQDKGEDVADQVGDKADDVAGKVGDVQDGDGVVGRVHRAGLRSEWAYAGAFLSIGASSTSWFVNRDKTGDSRAQVDRWGIFVGHWAPTSMAFGGALKLEERR